MIFFINLLWKNKSSLFVRCSMSSTLQQLIDNIFIQFICFASGLNLYVCLFFVALRPKTTAMVMAGRPVLLTTLFFVGKLEEAVNQ